MDKSHVLIDTGLICGIALTELDALQVPATFLEVTSRGVVMCQCCLWLAVLHEPPDARMSGEGERGYAEGVGNACSRHIAALGGRTPAKGAAQVALHQKGGRLP